MADPVTPQEEARLVAALQKWADGKATLREVRGYVLVGRRAWGLAV